MPCGTYCLRQRSDINYHTIFCLSIPVFINFWFKRDLYYDTIKKGMHSTKSLTDIMIQQPGQNKGEQL